MLCRLRDLLLADPAREGLAAAILELQPGHNGEEALVAGVTALSNEAKDRLSRVERIKSAVGTAGT